MSEEEIKLAHELIEQTKELDKECSNPWNNRDLSLLLAVDLAAALSQALADLEAANQTIKYLHEELYEKD